MLVGRTRFLDELCQQAVQAGCTQMVILGAGYDTRGFRVVAGQPVGLPCFEVDQPEVQVHTQHALTPETRSSAGNCQPADLIIPSPTSPTVQEMKKQVIDGLGLTAEQLANHHLVPVDFNVESVAKVTA
jgi:O-methyltransferase involved in polyketide biosynthesis